MTATLARTGDAATFDISGTVADISISGAGIIAPRHDALAVGASVTVEIAGAEGHAVIRRIDDIEHYEGLACYGIEYSQLSEPLHNLILELADNATTPNPWR